MLSEEKQDIEFLKKKDIEFSKKRYLQDALSAMALGLFASLLIGVIFGTLGEQLQTGFGKTELTDFLLNTAKTAKSPEAVGAAIGVAVATGLKAPSLVVFSSVATGITGYALGGPAGAFLAVAVGCEFGKAVSKETKVDIIVTPATTLITGAVAAYITGPAVGSLMKWLGKSIETATQWQPFAFGIFISVVVGLALTAPISSAALCMTLELSGLAAGAATVGCCAQMVGFAAVSFRENGIGGLVAQGLGTSMLQIPNICKNPWILLPPTLAAAVIGPTATVVFEMENSPVGAGMGTSGLVGQIGTFTTMGFSMQVFGTILLLHIVLPALLSLGFDYILRAKGLVKQGDYKLDI